MAIQYSISSTNPLSFPVTFVEIVLAGDGTGTSVVIPFAQAPFNIRANEKQTPSTAFVTGGGGMLSSFSFDPSSLELTINLTGTITGQFASLFTVQLYYDGV